MRTHLGAMPCPRAADAGVCGSWDPAVEAEAQHPSGELRGVPGDLGSRFWCVAIHPNPSHLTG